MQRIRFLIQKANDEPDGNGGYERQWFDVGYVWGEFKNVSGSSGSYDGALMQFQTVRVVVFDTQKIGLKIGWRLISDDQEYEITQIFSTNAKSCHLTLRSE